MASECFGEAAEKVGLLQDDEAWGYFRLETALGEDGIDVLWVREKVTESGYGTRCCVGMRLYASTSVRNSKNGL